MMQSYKDFFIEYVSQYGYGPLDLDYLEYIERMAKEQDDELYVREGCYE